MLVEDLRFGHTGAQPAGNIPHRDPEPTDAGLAAARATPASDGKRRAG
jgi:hypothetical protein